MVQTKKPVKKTVRKTSTKKVNNIDSRRLGGVVIVYLCVFAFVALLGGFYELSLDALKPVKVIDDVIDSNGKNASIDTDSKKLFEAKYYESLDVLSSTVGSGTTWLNICPDSQTEIDGEIYFKVCDDEYATKDALVDYLSSFFTTDYIEDLLGDNYIEYDGEFYIKPVSFETDSSYVKYDSFRVKEKSDDKIIYLVVSEYKDINCEDCESTYRDNKFILSYENDAWLVSGFELPY